MHDEAEQVGEGAAHELQGSSAQANGDESAAVASCTDDGVAQARKDYEAALAKRDARITELEDEVAEAAKRAEKMRAEMDELRKQGEEQRVGFELQMAGARNVKAAKALLADYDNDVDKLKVGEPWLFGTGTAAPAQTGTTGLPNAGAATDEGATMRRWRGIAGLPEDKE